MATDGTLPLHLEWAQPYLARYGYVALFGAVFVEGFGFPAPGQALVIAGAWLAARGSLRIEWVLSLAWLAAVLGDNVGYSIGRFGGGHLLTRYGRRLGFDSSRFSRVESFFARFGGVVVAGARFFDVLRQLNGVVAGALGMPWWRFFSYNAIGAELWVGVWGYGVYRLESPIARLLDTSGRFQPYVIAVALLVLAVLCTYLLNRPRFCRRSQ